MTKYFGTNGIRGRFDELTPELALRMAQAIGIYFGRGKILLARDFRLTGPTLHSAVVSGLLSVGCRIVDLGIVSSPTAEFMVEKLKVDGLIIITASHNAPEWNALKVVDSDGIAVSRERGEEIEKIATKINLAEWTNQGTLVDYKTATEEHTTAILKYAGFGNISKNTPGKNTEKKIKLVIDCGNGTASSIAPVLMENCDCEVIAMNANPDGTFPGRPSEPSEINVADLIASVKATKANAGIAWDGDGDRVIFVDETGSYVIGDKVVALSVLWLKEFFGIKTGDVVTTVATSKAVNDVAKRCGFGVCYTAVGAPYLSEAIVSDIVLGGEEVGGVIWPDFSLAKDGFLTAAILVKALEQKPLSKWLSEVPEYYNVKLKIVAHDAEKKEIVAKVRNYAVRNHLKMIDVDGVRIDFDDSWMIVRASGTEEYVRIFAEARNLERAEKLAEEFRKLTQ